LFDAKNLTENRATMKSRLHTLRSVIEGTVLRVICAGAIHAAVVYYRQAKAMEHAIDTLGAQCRESTPGSAEIRGYRSRLTTRTPHAVAHLQSAWLLE
jgi:hypothetical protein